MAKFTMLFEGLILHYDDETGKNAKTAVLVDERNHHVARLEILTSVTLEDEKNWPFTVENGYRKYVLIDRIVEVDKISTSEMKIDSSFYKHVPSLKKVLAQVDDLWPDVKMSKIKRNSAAAFVKYSGGVLSVLDCFGQEVAFDPPMDGDPKCIARTIRFDGTATGSSIKITDGLGGYIVLPENTTIWIRNIARHDGLHQKEYRRLMKAGKAPRPMKKIGKCESCSPRVSKIVGQGKEESGPDVVLNLFSLSIECSNSQWP